MGNDATVSDATMVFASAKEDQRCPAPWRQAGEHLRLESDPMTEQQRIAIEHHCRLACETLHPRFRTVSEMGTMILTVNSGYE